jgi:ankyrin repeat protein
MIDWQKILTLGIEINQLEMVKLAVKNGANANHDWALGIAAFNGHFDIVKYLIEKGADINNDKGYVLGSAIYFNNEEMIIYSLDCMLYNELIKTQD